MQDAVFAALWPGARAAAWKAGGPSDKVEPTAAPIPAENLLRSPASVAGATMQMIGVEAEVAFRLARDLPPRSRPYSENSIAAAVGEVLVAIELCDTRLADWKESSGLWKLADFQNNSALVAGSGTRDWQKIDFLQQEVEFRIGARVAQGEGRAFLRQPVPAAALAGRRIARSAASACTPATSSPRAHGPGWKSPRAGDEVTARFPGIGEATVRIN